MDDLKLIKKHYGEKMAHLCRELFPTILETEGLLFNVLSKKFAYSKLIYEDINSHIQEFKSIIYNELDIKKENKDFCNKTPKELLDEAGYILYECHTEEDIQKFKKYYAGNEELCTFRGNRLDSCHVFFAVKKNVDKIKREDFKGKEERQDEYGTSVISIQFSRGKTNTLSIKNRYNHTVYNPDATFSNNLDTIIEGLTASFEKTYNLNINSNKIEVDIPGFVLANDEKYYKYNFEEYNVYYCPNNLIIRDFEPRYYDQSRYLLIDKYLIDFKEKTIKEYLPIRCHEDSFCNIDIEKIETRKNKEDNTKDIIINDDIIITIDDTNQIIKYKDHRLRFVNDFLRNNRKLRKLDMPNIVEIRHNFLKNNTVLERISLPIVKKIGDKFLYSNKVLKEIKLPTVEIIREDFLPNNRALSHLNLPCVKEIGDYALCNNEILKSLKLPKIRSIGSRCFTKNLDLERICLPEVRYIGNHSFMENEYMYEIILPHIHHIGENVFSNNRSAEKIYMPNLINIPDNFLRHNNVLEELHLPSVITIGDNVLEDNEQIRVIVLKNVEEIKTGFLGCNSSVKTIIMPKVKTIGTGFLYSFRYIRKIEVPSLTKFDDVTIPIPPVFLPHHQQVQQETGLEICNLLKEVIEENKVKQLTK